MILSILGWTGLARVVRGKLLELRTENDLLNNKIVAYKIKEAADKITIQDLRNKNNS